MHVQNTYCTFQEHHQVKVKKEFAVKEESEIEFEDVYEVKEEVTVKDEPVIDHGEEGEVTEPTSAFTSQDQPTLSKQVAKIR